MASSPFITTEHIVDCQYIREYPRATRTTEDALKLVVKKYTPKSNPNPRPGDITIIGGAGGGYPKELYEPIWEELYERLKRDGLRIRSIWIANPVGQGASAVVNEENLGNDPSWFDHSRDLLYMINQFQADMLRPLMGVAHSLGAGQLLHLSLIHPRLFSSLVLVEPVIERDFVSGKGPAFAKLALSKKDVWRSQAEATAFFKKTHKNWDSRVLDLWLQHGLKKLRPESDLAEEADSDSPVTLATSKYQEAALYARPNFLNRQMLDFEKNPDPDTPHDASFHPDVVGPTQAVFPFYRSEPKILWGALKHIRPSVLYVYGGKSPISTADRRAYKLQRTGAGFGGSGGYKNGRVKEVISPHATHQLPFEDVTTVAEATAEWMKQETAKWKEEEERIQKGWLELTTKERITLPDEWHTQLNSYSAKGKQKPKAKL
ncbi:alpha/beta-hydrolase [Aspergillus sclerotioniger CBS 115572]|uniref:Alpha/beta-hydrolase n=1 Tax=Aspergillus sclerotioniger CBS 115572 TaxID=1450535 RepID=A0A317XGU0_9EURO|nr:alpha/beta-hydrolase [Aspergillus sclerotioniger CBS 115572]PWY96220.1 alpha/beta-hydrolase [Aspergillus sclerotioniger CBS 115572]